MTIDRTILVDALRVALDEARFARAAWLGGSDATGRTDRLSDIDLAVVVDDDAVEQTFELVETTLAAISPIELRLRLPQPTWHGHDQAFYRLRDAAATLMIDLSVMRLSREDRFLEPERHGVPIVLFDRDRLVVPAPLDRVALAGRMRARLEDLRLRFPMFQNLVAKAVERGSIVEAAGVYQSVTLRPLVDLLRIRWAPERFDFGIRYLQYDLPARHYHQLEWMAVPVDGAEILERQAFAEKLFARTIAEIDRIGVIDLFERGEGNDASLPTHIQHNSIGGTAR
jgi:predicted nucleotidyltransferase